MDDELFEELDSNLQIAALQAKLDHDHDRIVEFFEPTGIGIGDDPVGFLLASHAEMNGQRQEALSRLDKIHQSLLEVDCISISW